MQGRPLKSSDLIPLGSVPESSARQAGATVPADWLPSFPADKATPWQVRIEMYSMFRAFILILNSLKPVTQSSVPCWLAKRHDPA